MSEVKMNNIEIFKIYKLKENLQKGIEKYAKTKCEVILPIIDVFDDILFGVLTNEEKEGSVFLDESFDSKYLSFDRFYRISKDNLKSNIDEIGTNELNQRVNEEKEIEILQKIRDSFDDYKSNIKLTYIYKKSKYKTAQH
ncbi:hypothetical protein [Mycoplasmopsis edwardii]|nr:hypothetical protein [Mycoplasmopsis edwardii]